MGILKIKRDLKTNVTYVYDLISNKILHQWNDTGTSKLEMYLNASKDCTSYVIIPFNKPYKESCYKLSGHIKVVVDEEGVRDFLRSILGEDFINYLEEVAVSSVGEQEGYDLPSFLIRFYEATTKEEAEAIYNTWQELLPMNDTLSYKMLRTFESYREEILNYFELKCYMKGVLQ